jgi:hypothetical protein
MKLIVDPNDLEITITIDDKVLLIDLIDKLPNRSIDIIDVNYNLYVDFKDSLNGVKKMKKQESIV